MSVSRVWKDRNFPVINILHIDRLAVRAVRIFRFRSRKSAVDCRPILPNAARARFPIVEVESVFARLSRRHPIGFNGRAAAIPSKRLAGGNDLGRRLFLTVAAQKINQVFGVLIMLSECFSNPAFVDSNGGVFVSGDAVKTLVVFIGQPCHKCQMSACAVALVIVRVGDEILGVRHLQKVVFADDAHVGVKGVAECFRVVRAAAVGGVVAVREYRHARAGAADRDAFFVYQSVQRIFDGRVFPVLVVVVLVAAGNEYQLRAGELLQDVSILRRLRVVKNDGLYAVDRNAEVGEKIIIVTVRTRGSYHKNITAAAALQKPSHAVVVIARAAG